MSKFCFLFLTCSIPFICAAQGSFRDGFITTNEGDTLRGLVKYRDGAQVYKTCVFKESKNQKTKTYSPDDIAGYGFINDTHFESHEIDTGGSYPQRHFIELVVRGNMNLYRFKDRFFVRKDGQDLRILKNEQTEIIVIDEKNNYEEKRMIRSSNEHMAVLNIFMYDCPGLRSDIEGVKLNEKSLAALTEKYHECTGAPFRNFKAGKPWLRAMPAVMAGLNSSSIDFTVRNQVSEHLSGDFGISNSPLFGLSVDLISPRLSEHHALHADAFFTTSKYYSHNQYTSGAATITDQVTIELQQLILPFGYRYTFGGGAFRPFLNFGVTSIIHLSSKSVWNSEVERGGEVNTYTGEAVPLKSSQLGFWLGVGATYALSPKFDAVLDFRGEGTGGITPWVTDVQSPVDSSVLNFRVMLGLRLR